MSESSTDASDGSNATVQNMEDSGASGFTLQVISPDSSPLSFPNLPVSTTIKQLKAKIRDALPSKPLDDSQRLIYRGRLLVNENTTMVEVFGPEALAIPETQNLHLVLRQTASDTSTPNGPTPPPIAAPHAPPPAVLLNPQFINRPQSTPAGAAPSLPGMQAQQPLPGFQQMQQNQVLQQMAQQHHMMAQRLHQLQRETQRLHHEMALHDPRTQGRTPPPPGFNIQHHPGLPQPPVLNGMGSPQAGPVPMPAHVPSIIPQTLQNLINQQQRERAAEGRHGAQDAHNHIIPSTSSGRASPNIHRPDHVTTYTRETIGPNGERFHVTVNESTTRATVSMPVPVDQRHLNMNTQGHPALDVRAILRSADRVLANTNAQTSMQRSASNPGPAQASTATDVQSAATPSPLATPIPHTPLPLPTRFATNQNTDLQNMASADSSDEPTVYILSSSSGPRALLINNVETYFTPRHSRRQSPINGSNQVIRAPVGLPEFRNRPAGRAARRHQRGNDNPVHPPRAPHVNPGAGAIAAQIGPMLWLVVRLVGFVWFFTSGNTSWTRWLTVSAVAFLVFLYNTGIFNGAAEQLWGPIRRHLEALIPLGPPPVLPGRPAAEPQQPVPEAGAEGGPRRRQPEPEPAQVAARLLEERRQADRGWFMAQFRRAEHALLLFLASLVPGVGERHIAAREAEANAAEAERQRLIQAAEAAEAAEAAAAAASEEAQNGEANGEVATSGRLNSDGDGQADQGPPAIVNHAPPLVET